MVKDIYTNIAERTNGDIYIGVVGPVRTGKSTFIKRFMGIACYSEYNKRIQERTCCRRITAVSSRKNHYDY